MNKCVIIHIHCKTNMLLVIIEIYFIVLKNKNNKIFYCYIEYSYYFYY